MISVRLIAFALLLALFPAYAESDPWGSIQELMKQDTPQGNPQLETYLRSLTPADMIEAARQYAAQEAKKVPEAQWAEASMGVGLVLAYFGTDKGALPDDRLDTILKCIGDGGEGPFFRESLARALGGSYWKQLTAKQREESKQCLAKVLVDRKAAPRLRAYSCRALGLPIAEEYRSVVLGDGNVRALGKDKRQNLDALIRAGDVRLTTETLTSLQKVRKEVDTMTVTFSSLRRDDNEPKEVRDQAKVVLDAFAKLPLPAPSENSANVADKSEMPVGGTGGN